MCHKETANTRQLALLLQERHSCKQTGTRPLTKQLPLLLLLLLLQESPPTSSYTTSDRHSSTSRQKAGHTPCPYAAAAAAATAAAAAAPAAAGATKLLNPDRLRELRQGLVLGAAVGLELLVVGLEATVAKLGGGGRHV